jgi:hypothetical protein
MVAKSIEEVLMPNGARHAIGAVTGLVMTPVLAAGLLFGIGRLAGGFAQLRLNGGDRWAGAGAILLVAVLLGVLTGSRTSPLASLVPGIVFTGIGALWVIDPSLAARTMARKLPDGLDRGCSVAGPYGVLLLAGVFLLVASLPPSRWASRRPRPAGGPASGQGGPIPPYGQGVPAPPYGQAVTPQPHDPRSHDPYPQLPAPQAPPPQWEAGRGAVPAQRPSPEQLPGPFGAAPFEPGPSAPPAASSPPPPTTPQPRPEPRGRGADGDEDEAGGWTQTYGTPGRAKDEG